MSYDATWGFQNNFNEYGQEIKIIPKEKEEDLNRAFNDFLVDFTFILNKNGYEHYQLEIIDDYEEESVRKIALYFLKNTPKALTAISDLKCLDIYIPIGQKLNFTKFISNVQIDLGLSISYKQIDSDPFYCVNSLASAVKLLIENYLHSRNWISLYESGQSSMFWGLRYPSSSSVFHAVSVINVACSSQNNLQHSSTVRFQAKHIRYIPIGSTMDADSFKWTVSSAAQPCILQLSFPSKVPCFLWTTGEQVFLKEVVFSRQDSTLPYLTVLDCSSRRKGYLQFIPSTYASTEQYYGVSHGPIIQEQSLYSESNRLRYEMIRMYQDRKYNGTEDLANLMTCANFLVETPSGDRYVPLQSVVSAVSEYCGQSRTFASAIAATFCQHLLAVPGVLSVSAPRRIGTHLSPLQSLSELTVRGVQLSNIKHKFSDPEPRSTTTSPFIRASDLARFGASGKRDASGIANTQNDDDEDDDVSFASVTARIDDSLLAEDTIFGADVEDTDADFDDFFNAYTAPFSPTALDSITARNVRPRKECSTPPCRADLANKLRKSYNTTEDVLVDTWPAPPVPLVNSGHQSNPVDISGIAPGKRRHKHTPAKRMVSPDPDTANYDDFDKLFQDSQNFGYKVVSKTTKVNGSSGKNSGGSSSGHKKSK